MIAASSALLGAPSTCLVFSFVFHVPRLNFVADATQAGGQANFVTKRNQNTRHLCLYVTIWAIVKQICGHSHGVA